MVPGIRGFLSSSHIPCSDSKFAVGDVAEGCCPVLRLMQSKGWLPVRKRGEKWDAGLCLLNLG